MVMFKARFEPAAGDKPRANSEKRRAQQQPQPQPKAPPIEEERGPQNPVKLPGQPHEPERVS
jgi:hypothetical protein